MKKIPLIKPDLPPLEEIAKPLSEILQSGQISNFGPHCQAFEAATGKYLGVNTVAVSSGTIGLIYTMQALGVGPGSRVAIPSFTFGATAQAVVYAGGIPTFVDVDDDLCMSADDLAEVLRKHRDIDMVIAVHMYGQPADPAIEEVVRSHGRGAKLLYDAAHAFGASLDGRKCGTFGDAEVFSLSATKTLVSIEGGLVASKHPEVLSQIRTMRNYGLESYNSLYAGTNGKMSEIHALVGCYNMGRIDELMTKRQKASRYYAERVKKETNFELIPMRSGTVHTFKDFTVLAPEGMDRAKILSHMQSKGIDTRCYFDPPVHQHKKFRHFTDRALPRTEALSPRVITVPFFASITTEEMDFVVGELKETERCGYSSREAPAI